MSALQSFPLFITNQMENPNFFHLVMMIIDEMKQQKPNYRASVRGLLLALCNGFLRFQEQDQRCITPVPPENALVISPELDYIRDNYMNQFPIETLADICHLSGTHFRRVFNTIMGTSPLDYINNARIYKACTLLRSTEATILSISEQVGFRSVSSFNRYFIKVMGMSPRAWKTQLLQLESKEDRKKQSILEFSGWM